MVNIPIKYMLGYKENFPAHEFESICSSCQFDDITWMFCMAGKITLMLQARNNYGIKYCLIQNIFLYFTSNKKHSEV